MDQNQLLEKLKNDSINYENDKDSPNTLRGILNSWEPLLYYTCIEMFFNEDSTLSNYLLTKLMNQLGIGLQIYVYNRDVDVSKKLGIYLNYLERFDLAKLSFSEIYSIQKKLNSLEEVAYNTNLFGDYRFIYSNVSNKIKEIKSYHVVTFSVGDHEHDKASDYSIYCSIDSKELEKAYEEGAKKLSFDFLNYVNNEHSYNDGEYDGILPQIHIDELASFGITLNEPSDWDICSIYLAIAKLANPDLDYYRIDNHTISIWRYKY